MSTQPSFLWHDYETFGANPRMDRPSQFAGIRTDLDFNPIGEPVEWFCQPCEDVLPHPQACLITGITPQDAQERGLSEPDFIARVLAELGAARMSLASHVPPNPLYLRPPDVSSPAADRQRLRG